MNTLLGVSKNRGKTPNSSILIGFSIINHPFWGTRIFGNTPSWELTYPIPVGTFEDDEFPFPKGGICDHSLEGSYILTSTLPLTSHVPGWKKLPLFPFLIGDKLINPIP